MANNTDNTLPEELQKEIIEKSVAYVVPLAATTLEGIYLAQIYKDGATEYAQKYEQAVALLTKVLATEFVINSSQITKAADLAVEIKSFLDGSK